MSEKKVEKYFGDQVRSIGGLPRKFSSPGRAGVPDRVVLLPHRVTWYVEIKDIDGTPTVRQLRELEEYHSLGHHTAIAYGNEGVKEVIRLMVYTVNAARSYHLITPQRYGY